VSCSATLSRVPAQSDRARSSARTSRRRTHSGDGRLPAIESERRRLLRVACRLLGSSADAEDILQEAGMRWLRLGREREAIRNPGAYLTRMVTRLCLDVLRSGHNRCIRYMGIPLLRAAAEAPPGEPTLDPTDLHDLMADLASAFTVLLERLSPIERTVLLLREAFDFSYVEIAGIVDKSIQNSRQIERRARLRVRHADGRRWPVDVDRRARLVQAFVDATQRGDLDTLIAALSEDLVAGETRCRS
jgi:RNA polymerase sigma factor (sigma-70 family)